VLTIEEILGIAELPEESVPLCLKGTLVARFERLERELLNAPTQATSLGDVPAAAAIAREMDALREEMQKYTVPFELRALPAQEWSDFFNTQPEKTGGEENDDYKNAWHAWICAMVSVTCYQPAMTAAQVDALTKKLSGNQWQRLSDTAWAVNAQQQRIPFSAAASAVLQATGGKSRQLETSESPDLGSLAGSPEPSPSTSTTTSPDA
jgi:hypothetical protein